VGFVYIVETVIFFYSSVVSLIYSCYSSKVHRNGVDNVGRRIFVNSIYTEDFVVGTGDNGGSVDVFVGRVDIWVCYMGVCRMLCFLSGVYYE